MSLRVWPRSANALCSTSLAVAARFPSAPTRWSTNGEIKLTAICARPDGTELLREIGTGTDPLELGQRLGSKILSRGGDKILRDVYSENAASTTPR